MKNFTSFIRENKEKESKIQHFLDFASQYLDLGEKPSVSMVTTREPGMTTAFYEPKTGNIKVYAKDRAVFDICRSAAHELVHRRQHMDIEDPKDLDGSTGSPHEDEANAVAGRIVRTYGEQNPEFYE